MTGGPAREVRARGWRLLAALYRDGVTEELLPALSGVPALAARLPSPFDADEAAAEHHRLFSLEVFPCASVFLERDGVLGGPVADGVARAFRRAGLPRPEGAEPPDHLGHQLDLLAALTDRGDATGVAELLEGHLLWWLPPFTHSLGRVAGPFWQAVAGLTLDAALDQAAPAWAGGAPLGAAPPGALALPPENPLDERDAGLSRLARHLVMPARGGLYLARTDIRRLGRARELPGGFGRRELLLTNVLRAAAGYGELPGVVDDLTALAEGQREALGRLPRAYREPWEARLDRSVEMLAGLGSARTAAGGEAVS